ncbi:MAG: hypothetical protein VX346_21390 [Planctomycetota bacterium]|nr:hypothetical protein [Planctomycetota bacterium]
MNRSLQLLRMSVVLLITCLAGVQSAPCQVAALHGPIGRPSQSLSPGEESQLVEQAPSQSTPAEAEELVSSSNQRTTDAVPPAPIVDQAVVLRSGHDPAYDRAVYDNSVAKPSNVEVDGERYLADPRAVAMLSHGISRNVVVRRIALLSRLQEAAGQHRFAPQVVTKSVAVNGVTVPQKSPMGAVVSSACPYVDQKEQARLALQVPPEPPLATNAVVVQSASPAASPSRPNVPLAAAEQLTQPVPESTSPVVESPPEPGAPRLGYFIAVIDAAEDPGLGYFIAVIDGPEDTIGDASDDVTIASDPQPIGTGIGPRLAFEETPPEPGRDAIHGHPSAFALVAEEAVTPSAEELQQDPQVAAEDTLQEEVEMPLVLDTETLENDEDAAIVAEPSVATFDAFDGTGFDGGVLVDESLRPVPATTRPADAGLQGDDVGASPFPSELSPPAITPAIGRAFQQAWKKTFQRE